MRFFVKDPANLSTLQSDLNAVSFKQLENILSKSESFREQLMSEQNFAAFVPVLLPNPTLQHIVIEHLKDEINFKTFTDSDQLITYLEKALKDFKDFIAEKIKTNPAIINRSLISAKEFKSILHIFPALRMHLLRHVLNDKNLIWLIFATATKVFNFKDELMPLFSPHEAIYIAKKLIQCAFPQARYLNPLPYIMKQRGPNCGHYALSCVITYLLEASPPSENNFFCAYPARKGDQKYALVSLRSIAKRCIGIEGIGGILDIHQFAALARYTDLIPKVLYLPTESEFLDALCEAIDLQIPCIVPYDVSVNKNSSAPHYCVIAGYNQDERGLHHLLLLQHNSYRFMSSTELYERSECLNTYPKTHYRKDSSNKRVEKDYIQVLSKDESTYTYPQTSLVNTLQNRVLLVMTKEMARNLESNETYKKLIAHEEKRQSHAENKNRLNDVKRF